MKRILLSIILCLVLLVSFIPEFIPPVLAKTAYSSAAPSLVVNILNPDGTTTLVHEYVGVLAGSYTVYDSEQGQNVTYNYYSYPELEDIATEAYYSTIDAMPAAVGTKTLGVTINALVSDAQQYNPDIKWESGQSIRMYPTDAAGYPYQGNNFYNYDFVQGKNRYYYPNLVEAYTAYRANGEDTSYLENALDDPELVEPMFCLYTFQERYATDELLKTETEGEYTFKPNDDPNDWRTINTPVEMDSKESFRFCMGLTRSEAQEGIDGTYSSTNKFCRWVYQIDIGPMKGPSLTADRTDNLLGESIVITFSGSTDWRNAITEITVDGVVVDPAHYVISSGNITFDNTVFTTEGSHTVVVASTGYMNTEVTQAIEAPAAVAVTGVTLNKNKGTIVVGGTSQLTATVAPSYATNKDITWSSNNEGVATVSDGLVTAMAAGTATITVTTVDGGKKATCVVTVTNQEVSVTGVALNKTKGAVTVGGTTRLTATVDPDNATNDDLLWSSNNEAVARVDEGLVKGVAVGTAVITVTTVDGGKTDTCTMTVTTKVVPVTGVVLNKTTETIIEGRTTQLTAIVNPGDATNDDVTWSSDNEEVATASNGLVTAVAAGIATITVITTDGSKTATCVVTVTKPIAVTGVTLSKSTDTIIVGSNIQLTATIAPGNATNEDIIWSSDNKEVALVDNGLVTAVAVGTATITVATVDGDKTATCVITAKLSTVSLDGFIANEPLQLDSRGVTQSSSQIKTTDGKITFDILSGTTLSRSDNTVLSSLAAEILDSPPDIPSGNALVVAYELGPEGAVFDPPVNLTVNYGDLPARADENTIRIIYWNGVSWDTLPGNLDTANRLVTASISHFSKYAVVVNLMSPARIILSDLKLNPDKVNPGETVSVQATITNQGEMAGSCNVSFTVNDDEVVNQEIQLEPGQKQLLSFQIQRDKPGEYIVAVNEKTGRFVVDAPPINWILIVAITLVSIGIITGLAVIIARRKTGSVSHIGDKEK